MSSVPVPLNVAEKFIRLPTLLVIRKFVRYADPEAYQSVPGLPLVGYWVRISKSVCALA